LKTFLAALLALAACQDTHRVQLVIGGLTDSRLPATFRCRESGSLRFLAGRGFTPPGTLAFNVVVDFIGLDGGVPYASASSVVSWCADHDCRVLAGRVCLPLTTQLDTGSGEALVEGMRVLLGQLAGQDVSADAPDQPVIVRAVATAQPCSELGPMTAFDPADLVGCVVSVPIADFDGLDGAVVLDLPNLADNCVESITECATTAFE
jgi:hypothetical protein